MSKFDLIMPKLGESVQEATITKWFVKEGDTVEEDDPILEIATDKVDSEIPSPVAGVINKILFAENDLVEVGKIIAHIALEGSADDEEKEEKVEESQIEQVKVSNNGNSSLKEANKEGSRFYSPLVKSIAQQENVSLEELEAISGSGTNNRVTKHDIIEFIDNRKSNGGSNGKSSNQQVEKPKEQIQQTQQIHKVSVSVGAEDEIVEMSRMRRMIAERMVTSKHVAPHVTSMVEADVTNVVEWRNKIKDTFYAREKEKISFLPVFLVAMAKALKDFPGVNASVDGNNIILRKNINLGIAVALDNGNLIVPVIKNADRLNVLGMTKELNRLANAARNNKLGPDDVSGGTFSVSNFGSFKNVMGTPIINQPEVAIMAVGTVEKKPAVVETEAGDVIAVRHKMFLSLTYDHRVVDGALGGAFLRKVADYIEAFDKNSDI
ncbi:MAG: dihydrolipoamide acetyltransferase family protein [Bacteroidales bacterium]|nr:dihydrolipoamide acetyltransferase family protein [Bacteroidales bacterium]